MCVETAVLLCLTLHYPLRVHTDGPPFTAPITKFEQMHYWHHRIFKFQAVMWIRFVAAYCPKIPYILKLDDDSMVNYFGLIQLLQTRSRPNSVMAFGSKTLACSAFPGTPVVRTNSKWYPFEYLH